MTWRTVSYEDLIDADDPCGLLKKLKAARARLLAGEKEVEIEHQGNEGRRVEYHVANLSQLAAYIRTLESECAAKQGRRSRRPGFAVVSG
ncbi:MAG: gpW family head-tail joining protein [Hyphomicrobiales bacterium]|nr:gpW family head-tail joining protein [Hyphomicrobiales bacterium]